MGQRLDAAARFTPAAAAERLKATSEATAAQITARAATADASRSRKTRSVRTAITDAEIVSDMVSCTGHKTDQQGKARRCRPVGEAL